MNRSIWFLPPLFGVLLAPTDAWEASSSHTFGITVTKTTETIGLGPSSLTFTSQNTGTTSAAQVITATSTGTGAFPLSSVAISGANASSFSQTNNCPTSLAGGANCTINVFFTPTTTGNLTASVVVSQTGGGTYTVALSGTGTTPPPPPTSAFYVATTGSDSNAGTLAAPFKTFTKCQAAMQASSTVKTCYIRAGTYTPASGGNGCGYSNGAVLVLNAPADNGETWSYYPPDGYNTAIINGQASGNSGLGFGICSSANNLVVNGLYLENFQISGITTSGGSPIIENNIVTNITNTANATYCIGTENAVNGQIINNAVSNCTDMGIGSWPNSPNGANNLLIANNYVTNACSFWADCGGIYIENNNGEPESGEVLRYNYVKDINNGGGGDAFYLDDGTSNITLIGNVAAGSKWDCALIHGGSNNTFTGNICDAGSSGAMQIIVGQWNANTMTGNSWANNIVLGNNSGGGGGYPCNQSPCQLSIGPNAYFNYGGSSLTSSGSLGNDINPVNTNPNFACGWTYMLPTSTPVSSSPVNYASQPAGWGTAGFWGPPGFTIPRTGTAPSPPHSC
jgi:hypothetical protein